MYRRTRPRAFSLVELVIVIVIIGVIAAIAVPRISRGARGAVDSAMRGNLAVLRNSLELYSTEHVGDYPTVLKFVEQMTTYTNDTGADVPVKDSTHLYGPYIKKVPPLPVGPEKGSTTVAASPGAGVGWVYNETSGDIVPNTALLEDEAGVKYTDY